MKKNKLIDKKLEYHKLIQFHELTISHESFSLAFYLVLDVYGYRCIAGQGSTLQTLKYFLKSYRDQRCFFPFEIIINGQLFPFFLHTYVMGLQPLYIFVLLQSGDRLYTLESDVYRRQIRTSKVDARTVKVNIILFNLLQ